MESRLRETFPNHRFRVCQSSPHPPGSHQSPIQAAASTAPTGCPFPGWARTGCQQRPGERGHTVGRGTPSWLSSFSGRRQLLGTDFLPGEELRPGGGVVVEEPQFPHCNFPAKGTLLAPLREGLHVQLPWGTEHSAASAGGAALSPAVPDWPR